MNRVELTAGNRQTDRQIAALPIAPQNARTLLCCPPLCSIIGNIVEKPVITDENEHNTKFILQGSKVRRYIGTVPVPWAGHFQR